jgi:hypothetical protein
MCTVTSEVPSRKTRGQDRPGSRHDVCRRSRLRAMVLVLEALEGRALLAILPAAPTSIALDPSTDTGTFDNDDITRDNNSVASPTNAPLFDVAGIEPGATVELFRDAALVATMTTTAGGNVPIYDTNGGAPGQDPIPDGTYLYQAEQVDPEGNTSAPSPSVSVTIASTPPLAPSAPVLDPSSYTGTSSTMISADNQPSTQDAPRFDVSNVLAGASVELLRNGVVVNTLTDTTGGTVSIDDINAPVNGPIPDGTYTYTAIQIDLAGNVSPSSPGATIQIVTTAPPIPSTLRLDANSDTTNPDTGGSNADGITRVTLYGSPVFDVSGVVAGATVNLYRIPPSGSLTLVNSTTAAAAGTVTLSDPSTSPDGTYTYEVQQIDPAGNASATGDAITVIYQTATPPTPAVPKLVSPSTTDAYGNIFTTTTSPTFSVSGVIPSIESGASGNVTVDLVRDGTRVAFIVAPKAGGTVEITDPGPVPDGPHTYQAYQIDDAGNISALSGLLTVSFLPGPPAAPRLDASTDSGVKGDNITNDNGASASPSNAPIFDVTGVTPGNTAELFRDGLLVGSAFVSSNSPVKVTDTSVPIPDGTYVYTVAQADPSGLVGPASPPLVVKIATGAAAPTTLMLDPRSITGTSGANTTSSTSLILDVGGVNLGSTVNLYRGGILVNSVAATATNTVANTTMIADPSTLSPGTYAYTATLTDFVGNTSRPTPVLTVNVTAAPPAQPSLALDPKCQTGTAGGVTNMNNSPSPSNAPVFDVGGISPGATVELFCNGAMVNSMVSTAGGASTIADINAPSHTAIPDGSYSYTAQQVVAGIASPFSATVALVIKSKALTPTLALDPASNNGLGSHTTAVRRPIIDVTGADGGASLTLAIRLGNTNVATLGPLSASGTGTAAFTTVPSLGNGAYTITVQSRDLAGNTSTASMPLTITTVNGDYTGAGHADLAVFRRVNPGLADFFVQNANPPGGPAFGSGSLDIPFQGDTDGDGKTDLILYRPSTATWFIQQSSAGFVSFSFGAPNTDIPVVGNFDGTGKTEVAVYRPSTGQWFVGGHAGVFATFGGDPSDLPVPGNYDGLGYDQLALYRQSTGQWFIGGHAQPISLGGPGDVPVPGNYDGTGMMEEAVYRPSTGQWFINGHTSAITINVPGYTPQPGDIPAPADYDGTGRTEEAVYRPSTSQWFIEGHAQPASFGGPTDIPLAAPYVYRKLNPASAPGAISAASVAAPAYDFGASAVGLSVGPAKAKAASATVTAAPVVAARVRPNQEAPKTGGLPGRP